MFVIQEPILELSVKAVVVVAMDPMVVPGILLVLRLDLNAMAVVDPTVVFLVVSPLVIGRGFDNA